MDSPFIVKRGGGFINEFWNKHPLLTMMFILIIVAIILLIIYFVILRNTIADNYPNIPSNPSDISKSLGTPDKNDIISIPPYLYEINDPNIDVIEKYFDFYPNKASKSSRIILPPNDMLNKKSTMDLKKLAILSLFLPKSYGFRTDGVVHAWVYPLGSEYLVDEQFEDSGGIYRLKQEYINEKAKDTDIHIYLAEIDEDTLEKNFYKFAGYDVYPRDSWSYIPSIYNTKMLAFMAFKSQTEKNEPIIFDNLGHYISWDKATIRPNLSQDAILYVPKGYENTERFEKLLELMKQ